MKKTAEELVLKIEEPIIHLERIIKGLDFVAEILSENPEEIDCGGLKAFLTSMSISAYDAMKQIKENCGITD